MAYLDMGMGTRPRERRVPTVGQTASEPEGCSSLAVFQKTGLVLEGEVSTTGFEGHNIVL